jgi:hypothetical protein
MNERETLLKVRELLVAAGKSDKIEEVRQQLAAMIKIINQAIPTQ